MPDKKFCVKVYGCQMNVYDADKVRTVLSSRGWQETGESALMEIMDDHVSFECVKVLLENGADVNIRDDDGETALMKALDENVSENIINALLDSGANVKIKDNKGRDIFHYTRKAHRLQGSETIKRIEKAMAE